MTSSLRPMTLAELLDRAFQLYRRHLVVLAGLVALPMLAVLAVQLAQAVYFPTRISFRPDPDLRRAFANLGVQMLWAMAVLTVTVIASAVAQSATVLAVADLNLDKPITIGRAFAGVRPKLPRVLLVSIVITVLVALGTVFCIVPGILLALRWAFVCQTVVVEDAGLGEAMSRSAVLTDGNRGRIFMIYFLFFILSLTCSAIWQAPTSVAILSATAAGHAPPTWSLVLAPVGGYVTQVLVGPLLHIAITLSYFDARVKKEGFDLDYMLKQIENAGPPTAAV